MYYIYTLYATHIFAVLFIAITQIKKAISELEEAALSEKPWQLMGEAGGSARPEDSLLQEDLEFDSVARPGNVY